MLSGTTSVEDRSICPENVAKKGGDALLAEKLATCADCPGKWDTQSSSRGWGKKGHSNWKGADTPQAAPQEVNQIGQEVHVEWGQVSSDVPQVGTATSEDKEVKRLWTEDSAEDRELEQLLNVQERMVIHTNEVTVMGDSQP